MLELIGQNIDRYQVVAQLEEYSWGSKYKGYDPKIDRTVVLTVLPDSSADQAALDKRLLAAGRAMMTWRHSGIARIFEIGETKTAADEPIIYIVSEYIAGANLSQILEELHQDNHWVSLTEAIGLICEVCLALEYAHKRKVFHGNLSPKHIYFRLEASAELPYQPVLVDIGLPKSGLRPNPSTGIAHRQAGASGQSLQTPKDDIFSLGILLYELSTGQLPPGVYPATTEAIPTQSDILPPGIIRADLPKDLENVILKALSIDPKQAYPDIHSLYEDLSDLLPAVRKNHSAPEGFEIVSSLLPSLQESLVNASKAAFEAGVPVPEMERSGADLSKDQIHIYDKDQSGRVIAMKPGGLSIGRSAENDIVIDHPGVSHRHARIEFIDGKYQVIDLDSKNGTFIEDHRLPSDEPHPWSAGENLRIAETWLRLEQASQKRSTDVSIADETVISEVSSTEETKASCLDPDGNPLDTDRMLSSPGKKGIAAYLEPAQLSVSPGSTLEIGLGIVNQGPTADIIRVSINNLPLHWIRYFPTMDTLQPNEQQYLKLILRIPRSPESRAGRYRALIRLTIQNDPQEVLELPLNLTVSAYSQFHSELQPEQISASDTGQVYVYNQGNLPEIFTLTWVDVNQELSFEPSQVKINVPAGKSAAVEFRTSLIQPHWFGSQKSHAYNVHINSQSSEMQTHKGELNSQGLVPPWAPLALFILCLVISCTSLFLYNQLTLPSRSAQKTASAGQTALVISILQTQQAGTATAAVLQNANQATIQAATATAQWLMADDDLDGLNNSQELEAGTRSDLEDTDEDGLNDGDEVNIWLTDPLSADTDGDGLKDGQEVQEGIDPLKKDTDGDGIEDAVDPDPLHFPTKTALPIPTKKPATPSPTADPRTPTASATIIINTIDLSISVQNGQSSSIPGETMTYTILVKNKGPASAANAIVTDMFPSSLSNIIWNCTASSGSKCLVDSGIGNINAGVDLLNGGSATFSATAKLSANASGVLINTASVSAPPNLIESNTVDNLAMDTDTISPQVSLEISKTDGRTSIYAGQSNTYTILVSNSGPSNVSGVNITDVFPGKITNITWTCEAGDGSSCTAISEQAGNINTLVNIASDSSITILASGNILDNAQGILQNSVTINSPVDPGNNNKTATDTTELVALADLELDILAPITASVSTPITYTVTITNHGPSDASAISFNFVFPEGTSFTSSSPAAPNCEVSSGSLVCDLGAIPAKSEIQVLICIQSPASTGMITAEAQVSAGEDDPLPANNDASVEVQIE